MLVKCRSCGHSRAAQPHRDSRVKHVDYCDRCMPRSEMPLMIGSEGKHHRFKFKLEVKKRK